MTYKRFKVERKVYGPDGKEYYAVYGKHAGWFKTWQFIADASDKQEAELLVKRYAKYPHITRTTYYNEKGNKEYEPFVW